MTVALDNFGCGNSSLSYLKRFPIDIVKIDRLFIADLERDAASRLIVSVIAGIAHGLRMTVVAEGVESSEQLQEIGAVGCDSYQEFYFDRSMSADDIRALATGDRRDLTRIAAR